jgi:hypothetical protein
MPDKMYVVTIKDKALMEIIRSFKEQAEEYKHTKKFLPKYSEAQAAYYTDAVKDLESQMKKQDYMCDIASGQHLTNTGGK